MGGMGRDYFWGWGWGFYSGYWFIGGWTASFGLVRLTRTES